MGDEGRTIHIRLSPRWQQKLERLHAHHFAGLPLSVIAKLLLCSTLLKDEADQVALVQEQIRTPAEEDTLPRHERLPNLNTHRRKGRR